MKFWRKRQPSDETAWQDAMIQATLHVHAEQLRDLRQHADELSREVTRLRQAEHDHCVGCGERTHEHGQTHCGRHTCRTQP